MTNKGGRNPALFILEWSIFNSGWLMAIDNFPAITDKYHSCVINLSNLIYI
jgi:hypothetical protein